VLIVDGIVKVFDFEVAKLRGDAAFEESKMIEVNTLRDKLGDTTGAGDYGFSVEYVSS